MNKKTLKAYEDLIEALAPSDGVYEPMVPGVTGKSGAVGALGVRGPDGAVMPLEAHNEIMAMCVDAFTPRRPTSWNIREWCDWLIR
jgi:hypothetical protein